MEIQKNNNNMDHSNNNDPEYLTSTLIDFEKYFPILMKSITNYAQIMDIDEFGTQKVITKTFSDKMENNLLPLFNDEINKALSYEYWNTLLL